MMKCLTERSRFLACNFDDIFSILKIILAIIIMRMRMEYIVLNLKQLYS